MRGKTGGERYMNSQKTFIEDESGTFETTNLTSADISGILEVREDNREQFKHALWKALARGLEEVGLVAEGYAKRLCPVDTGRLRNSITHVTSYGAKAVYIGTNVEYAEYVEKGTSRQEKQPFLEPAAKNHGGQYRAIIENELRNG